MLGEELPGEFEDAQDFSEGLAAACIDDKWGSIDRDGRFAITPQFVSVLSFSEGLAAVEQKRIWYLVTVWGFIDKAGHMAIPPRFSQVFNGGFHQGEALVKSDGECAVIDRSGQVRVPANPPSE